MPTGDEWPKQRPQRQDSLTDQLRYVHRLASRYGCYDAADWLWHNMQRGVEAPAGSATPTDHPLTREHFDVCECYRRGADGRIAAAEEAAHWRAVAGSETPTGDGDE